MTALLCAVCAKNQALLLCDYHIGAEIVGYNRVGRVAENRFSAFMGGKFFTCDAPLCHECAVSAVLDMLRLNGVPK